MLEKLIELRDEYKFTQLTYDGASYGVNGDFYAGKSEAFESVISDLDGLIAELTHLTS